MIVARAPFRISLFGGGTDFPEWFRTRGGAVLSATLDKYAWVTLGERFDPQLLVSYRRVEEVSCFADLQNALVRECLSAAADFQQTGERGLEIHLIADLPTSGTGLGGSAAMTAALTGALFTHAGREIAPEMLARAAVQSECAVSHIGWQDQWAAAVGGCNLIRFGPGEQVDVQPLPWRPVAEFSHWLALYYLCPRKSEVLHQAFLVAMEARELDLYRMARMAEEGTELLRTQQFDALGDLLDQAWVLKQRTHPGCTTAAMKVLYEGARAAGALGGKVCGAGGGGFFLICRPPEKAAAVSAVV